MSVNLRDSATNKWHFTFSEEPPSAAVIDAIVFATNKDPLETEPLAHVIDPDAMDSMLSRDDAVTISFRWEGYNVEVSNDGEIVVY